MSNHITVNRQAASLTVAELVELIRQTIRTELSELLRAAEQYGDEDAAPFARAESVASPPGRDHEGGRQQNPSSSPNESEPKKAEALAQTPRPSNLPPSLLCPGRLCASA